MRLLQILAAMVGCGWVLVASATAQMPDALVLDGETVELHTNPLERYFDRHPERRPKSSIISSGLWRGYRATFAVMRGRLYVRKVEIMTTVGIGRDDRWKNVVAETVEPGARFASFYSGALIIPRGELVEYVHMGYASTYERYTVLSVKEGVVTARHDLTRVQFEEFRRRQFERFRASPAYAPLLKETMRELSDGPDRQALAEQFLFEFYQEQYLAALPEERARP
ncbi:MAG: hypothetical protein AB7R89_18410 [Dehalococcoidia bacterium]